MPYYTTEIINKKLSSIHLCKCNGVLDLLKHVPLHMCYHAKSGRSALKGAGINAGALELCCLGMEVVAGPRYSPSPTCVTASNLV